MGIAFVQAAGAGNGQDLTTDTKVVAILTSPVTVGDLIVVGITHDVASDDVTSVTDGLGNTYTRIGTVILDSFSNDACYLYYSVVTTGGPSCTITANLSITHIGRGIVAGEWSGLTGTPLDQSNTTTSGSTGTGTDNAVSSSITPTVGSCLIVAFGQIFTNSAITPGTGFTERIETAIGYQEQLEDLTQTSAAPVTGKWTVVETGINYNAIIASFKPASNILLSPTLSPLRW